MKFIFVNIMMGMHRGGGENYDLNLSKKLLENNHEVEFLYLKPLFQDLKISIPDIYLNKPVKSPWLYNWSLYVSQIKYIGNLRGLRGIPRAIGQFLFEMQVFYNLFKRRNEKFILHICGLSLLGMLCSKFLKKQVYTRFPGPPIYKLHNFFIKNTYAIVANGDAYKQIKKKIPESNLKYIDVGINFSNFNFNETKKKSKRTLKLSINKKYVLFVGRIVPIKNLSLLVNSVGKVFKEFNDWDLIIIGEGPDERMLRRLSDAHTISSRVHLLGPKTGDILTRYYRSSDIFVLPSLYDNFSNVVLEAMAMKLPVIATNSGGAEYQIKHNQNGYLVRNNNVEDLSEKLRLLMQSPKKRKLFGEQGYNTVNDKFNWDETMKLFLIDIEKNNKDER